MSQEYYDQVNGLSPKLREIHDYCYDVFGRPNHDRSLQIAIGRLCVISDDWDTFKKNCNEFFYSKFDNYDLIIDIAWHCYCNGIMVGLDIAKDAA